MTMDRRSLLKVAGLAPLASPRLAFAQSTTANQKADYALRIANGLVELAPDHIVSTTLYNGQFPGPLFRFTEGKRAVIDIHNDTDTPELVHWHGQMIPSDVDSAAEEGSPFVPAHGMRRIAFVPKPSGFRFVHTHVVAGGDLNRGTYSGQSAPVYIEPKYNPGAYDREVFLVLKEFAPSFSKGGDMAMDFLAGQPVKALQDTSKAADAKANTKAKGYEVGYDLFSINGKMLGHGDPIRVKQGERVLFHIVNASATEIRSLTLPGHVFRVVALDGNPVPTPADVPVLWLGTAERVSAMDTSPVFEPAKHVLDLVALAVEGAVMVDRRLAVDLRGNAGSDAAFSQGGPEPAGVVSSVTEQGFGRRQGVEHQGRTFVIAHLAFAEQHHQWTALTIAHSMELGV